MKLKDIIHHYVTYSINEKTRCITDFGLGIFTTINYMHWNNYLTVFIKNGKSNEFNMNKCTITDIVNWIYDNINVKP